MIILILLKMVTFAQAQDNLVSPITGLARCEFQELFLVKFSGIGKYKKHCSIVISGKLIELINKNSNYQQLINYQLNTFVFIEPCLFADLKNDTSLVYDENQVLIDEMYNTCETRFDPSNGVIGKKIFSSRNVSVFELNWDTYFVGIINSSFYNYFFVDRVNSERTKLNLPNAYYPFIIPREIRHSQNPTEE